jgi:FkbM family methyltransferase
MARDVALARQTFLPAIYRSAMRMTSKHGMRTLSRINHRLFPAGQVIRLSTGADFFVPPDPHFFGYIVEHERHVMGLIETMVEDGDTCVDVGANIGYFTMAMAGAVGRTGHVLAYEPEPSNLAILKANVERASELGLRVEAIEAAVSDHSGVVKLVIGPESTLHQTFDPSHDCGGGHDVTSVRLDDDLPARGVGGPIKLMKIDVEGHELAVLQGVEGMLRSGRVAALVVEVTPGDVARDVHAFLHALNASTTCWIDSAWKDCPINQIPHRTDVLARF